MINSIPTGNNANTASNAVFAVYLCQSFWMVLVYVYRDD